MIIQHNRVGSDILAATGIAGMQPAAGEGFWIWRRIVLTIGYGLVFVAGLVVLVAADPTGLILIAAALAGVIFLHRIWLGVAIWAYVLVDGAVAASSGDDLGFYGVIAGLGFGLIALPIWSAKRAAPPPAYWTPQSPFAPPVAHASPPSPGSGIDDPAVSSPAATSITASKAPTVPMIRTIGRICLLSVSGDLTASLIRKPVIGFLWLYLLARQVRTEGDRVTRSAVTDEVAHGVSDPRGRLRGYLRDLTRMPEPFGAMVRVDDEMIGFDLGECDSDFARLRRIAVSVRDSNGHIDDGVLREAHSLLQELGDGEFMPGFEEMEKRVTQGRGVAGLVVAEARSNIDGTRADLADAVAKALLDRGEAAQAVALLEPIVARSEERDDVARTLINALRESGQHKRAAEIRRRFAPGQES
jgi:hypothetical protein